VNSYKFALVRALAHLATHAPRLARWERIGRVSIDIVAVAELWVSYYWPVVRQSDDAFIYQGQRGEKADMAFRPELTSLSALWEKSGGREAFFTARNSGALSAQSAELSRRVLSKIRPAIRQPIRYAGNERTGKNTFSHEKGRISLPGPIWTELAVMGRWIEDSVVIRWAEFTEGLKHQRPGVTAAEVLSLLLARPEGDRDTDLAREAFLPRAAEHALTCVWTGKTLSRFHVDHAIPWALWRTNDLWNLFPADPEINSEKSNQLPSRERVIDRRRAILESWEILYQAHPRLFLSHASVFTGTILKSFAAPGREELFDAFKDAIEFTAVNRGVGRW